MTISGMKRSQAGLGRQVQLVARHFDAFYRHNTARKLFNLGSLYLQKWLNRSVLTAYPAEIVVDVCNICNLHCPLCPTGQGKNGRPFGKMGLAVYRRIIDELSPWLYKVRLYNWGEPMLHEDIHRLIAYARDRNVGTEISSNLNHFRPEDAAKLVDSGLELLVVSLDGADQQSYARYRVGGVFDRVVRNISALVEEKRRRGSRYPIIEIQFLAMRHNEGEIAAMARLAASLGADRFFVGAVTVNLRNPGDAQWLPADERKSRYAYEERRDKIYRAGKKCAWLWRSAVINWDGTVTPCCVFESPEAEVGRLEAKGFAEVWNGDKYREAREVFTGKQRGATGVVCGRCRGVPTAPDKEQHGLY